MLIKCILYDEKNEVIDYVNLSYFSTKRVILIPFDKGIAEKLSKDQEVRIQIENKYDKIYDGKVEQIYDDKIFIKNIRNIGPILHNDVRVMVDIPSTIYYENDEERFEYDVRVRNISSGGMCFACREDLDMNDIYETVVEWIKTPIVVKFKLLRKEYDEYNNIVYGCKFIDLLMEEEFLLRAGVYYIQAKKFKPNRSNVKNEFCEKMY